MATITLPSTPFSPGQQVGAYARVGASFVASARAAQDIAVVQGDTSVTFTNLDAETDYWAAARSGGSWQTHPFRSSSAASGGGPSVHKATHEPGGTDQLNALTDTSFAAANKDGLAATASLRTLGSGAQQAAGGTHVHVATSVTDFSEAVDDRVSALLVAGPGIAIAYNDPGNALTVSIPTTTELQIARIGLGTPAVAATRVALPVGTTAADGVRFGDIDLFRKTGGGLSLAPSAVIPVSESVGGALLIENTSNTGDGLVIYSNQAAPAAGAKLLSVFAANATFTETVVSIKNAGIGNAVNIQNTVNSGDSSSLALNVTSANTADTTLGASGSQTARGVVKFTHDYPGSSDVNASVVSLYLAGGASSAAQGIFLDTDAAHQTTAKLLNLRLGGVDQLTLDGAGAAFIRSSLGVGATAAGGAQAGVFISLGGIDIQKATAYAIRNYLTAGDAQPKWNLAATGEFKIGAGGASAVDVSISRLGAGILQVADGNGAYGSTSLRVNTFRHGLGTSPTLSFFNKAAVAQAAALTAANVTAAGAVYGAIEQAIIENTRTRVNELESRLSVYGLLP